MLSRIVPVTVTCKAYNFLSSFYRPAYKWVVRDLTTREDMAEGMVGIIIYEHPSHPSNIKT